MNAMEKEITGQRILIKMDSRPAISNLEHEGGPREDLVREVGGWMEWAEARGIKPTYAWVPRESNTTADAASKRLQKTEQLTREAQAKATAWMQGRGMGGKGEQLLVPATDSTAVRLRWHALRESYTTGAIVVPGNWSWSTYHWLIQAQREGRAYELGPAGEVLVGKAGTTVQGWTMWVVEVAGRRAGRETGGRRI